MGVDRATSIEYRNKLVNGNDYTVNPSLFAPNLVGNSATSTQATIQITVGWSAESSGAETWDLTTSTLTRQFGSFQKDGFRAGQKFAYLPSSGATADFEATIDAISEDGTTITFTTTSGTATPATGINTGLIKALGGATENQFAYLAYRFGLPSTNEEFTIKNRATTQQQRYALNNISGTLQDMQAQGTVQNWVTGTSKARLASTSLYSQTYEVVHDFLIAPWYLEDQLSSLQDNSPPSYFAGDECLRHCFELELRPTASNPNNAITARIDDSDGFTGWFDENYNGLKNNYSLSSISYTDTATGNTVNSLQVDRATNVAITIAGTFSAGQRAGIIHSLLPSQERYNNTENTLLENYLYDSVYVAEGATAESSTIITDVTSAISGSDLVVNATIAFSADQGVIADSQNYLLSVNVGTDSESPSSSDAVNLLCDVQAYKQVEVADLMSFIDLNFAFADEEANGDDATTDFNGYPTDAVAVGFSYELDIAKEARVTALQFRLIADNENAGTSFELDRYDFDLSNAAFSGGVQSVSIDASRGYPYVSGSQYNKVELENASILAGKNIFEGVIAQKIRWEDWLKNSNADQIFYDSAKPNNNLNFLSSNYSSLNDFDIRVEFKATVLGLDDIGVQRQQEYSFKSAALPIRDYTSEDGYTVTVSTLDPESNEDLGGKLLSGKDTKVRVLFSPQDGFIISATNAWAAVRLCKVGNAGQQLFEIATDYTSQKGGLLKPIDGQFFLQLTEQGSDLVTECLVDGSQVESGNYLIVGRYDQTLNAILVFNTLDDSFIQVVKTGTAAIIETIGNVTRVFLPDNDPETITAFYADDPLDPDQNAGISSDLNLDDRFTGLRDVRARNQNFGFVSGTWVRNEDVSIDVENSIITTDKVTEIIDSIITSNGGTVSDDGTNFTGSAGETHANRTLNIGTIELDLSAPENSILFQKITALEAVGWTITTVLTLCLKNLEVDTSGLDFIASEIEKTRELVGLDFVSGQPLDVKLYDTEANAKIGGATGLLADGFAAFSAWVLDDANYNAWIFGNPKGIRFEASALGSNKSVFKYKSFPNANRACGNNELFDYFTGKAKVYDESGYDEFDLSTITSNNQSFSVLVSLDQVLNNNFSEFLLLRDSLNRTRYYAAIISNQFRWFANSDSNNSVPADGVKRTTTVNTPIVSLAASGNRARIIFAYDGTTKEMKIAVDGARDNVISLDGTPLGTFTPDYIRIGDSERIGDGVGAQRLAARVRRFEIVDFALTDSQIVEADEKGSLRAVADASNLLLDIDYQKADGVAPTTSSDTPVYTNTPLGNHIYTDF